MNLNSTLGLINRSVRGLKAYHLEPEDVRVKLNQNENGLDWPQAVKDEVADFCRTRPWNRYPDFIPEGLMRAVASYAGVTPGSVVVGNGSNEMLLLLLLSLSSRERPVILCQPTFTVYQLLAVGLGRQVSPVPLAQDFAFDVDALVRAASENPGALMILCSPNNPTGSTLAEQEIRTVLGAHSGFMLLDQAYVEFGGYDAVPLLSEFPNLIITRTFSKALGGAAIRLGYMLGSEEVVAQISKLKLPYNINSFSEYAASSLLTHQEHLHAARDLILSERTRVSEFLASQPFDKVYPGAANFVLVRTGRKSRLFSFLRRDGILVRDVSSYPMLENCLRITIGTRAENDSLMQSVSGFFGNEADGF